MPATEHIAVADVSDGSGGTGRPGTRVRLPVVELLTGRGFVTGKSGSGKSNTASVVAENLLDNGFGLLIVDIDGEYYGLKEAYEILHVGGDDECDIQVTAEHAEKLATLALEENVPIILDVSSYLDEDEAEELLTAVSRQLFAKAKKQKQPFLLLVEEVHEYIPENGSVGECGKMLIKIGKRGRKHGLGICGISQRPADVKKDFITQCDWLVWHRLTWDNDTNVVRRVLDRTYADAVEDLDDGEAFLKTDWSGTVRRVQFDRKDTFDAGATPGLDDFERPELKSVSDDLVAELSEISEAQQAREDRIAELREELDRKNSRIAELETELQDARDLSRMADQFVAALVEEVRGAAPGRTERERLGTGREADANTGAAGTSARRSASDDQRSNGSTESGSSGAGAAASGPAESDDRDAGMAFDAFAAMADDGVDDRANGEAAGGAASGTTPTSNGSTDDAATADAGDEFEGFEWGDAGFGADDGSSSNGDADHAGTNGDASGDADFGAALEALTEESADGTVSTDVEGAVERDAQVREQEREGGQSQATATESPARATETAATTTESPATTTETAATTTEADATTSAQSTHRPLDPDKPAFVRRLIRELRDLDDRTRGMLVHYHERGPSTPIGAQLESGGGEDRNRAYARNRTLRKAGYVEHLGRGKYAHRLPRVLEERAEVDLEPSVHQSYVDYVVKQAAPA